MTQGPRVILSNYPLKDAKALWGHLDVTIERLKDRNAVVVTGADVSKVIASLVVAADRVGEA